MRDNHFKAWIADKYPNPNSWKTYLSETRRIFKYKGDLDELYEKDQFAALLKTFHHSKKHGIAPTDDIPHKADPYVTADFRRRCIELYAEFYQQAPRKGRIDVCSAKKS